MIANKLTSPISTDVKSIKQEASASNTSHRRPVRLPDIVYLTGKRARAMRLINPAAGSLYVLIAVAALGFLVLTFLGL